MRLQSIPKYLLNPNSLVARLKQFQHHTNDKFLRKISGVIHVGANTGQERELYKKYNLDVIWIEPIPDTFLQLKKNLEVYPKQHAYQYLITNSDNKNYEFHIATNDGMSSSIFEFSLHKDVWPEIDYEKVITLPSLTLPSFIKEENIDIKKYDGLVLDTQGAELLVLAGASNLLHNFKFIKAEVADFESYKGGCQLKDIEDFLKMYNFQESSRVKFAERNQGESYYDIVYRRT